MERTLRVGGLGRPALRRRLRDAGVRLNPLAEALFEDPRWVPSRAPRTVTLVEADVATLDLPVGACFPELLARAASRGWRPCPLEVAPHLRLAWLDQPEVPARSTPRQAPAGSLTVATTAPADGPRGFYLRAWEGAPWLRGYTCDDEHRWAPGDRFVFLVDRAAGADAVRTALPR